MNMEPKMKSADEIVKETTDQMAKNENEENKYPKVVHSRWVL